MVKSLIGVWLLLAVSIAVAAALVPSVKIDGGVLGLLGVAFLFGLVNAALGPVLHLVSLPLTVVTFGLFGLVVNGVLLALTAGLSDSLDVGGIVPAIIAAIVISVVSTALLLLAARLFLDQGRDWTARQP